MKDKLVSIIIVNYNGSRFLSACFSSLEKIDYPNYEIIFVDNASHDESVEFVKEHYPRVKILKNKENLGFAQANNQACSEARGEYLFFLNNDTKVDSKILSCLVKKMEDDESIGICGCRIMSYDGRVHFHTGIGIDIFGYPVNKGEVFYAEGSALMIRNSLFHKLGGFDEKYFMFHEDIDLAWQVWLLGYRVVAADEAVVYHVAGGSAGGRVENKQYKSTLFRKYFSERNNIRTLLKNYSVKSLFSILPIYFLINLAEIIFFLSVLKPKVSFCYLKAIIWNLINFKNTLVFRKKIQRRRKITDKRVLRTMYKRIGKYLVFKNVRIPEFE